MPFGTKKKTEKTESENKKKESKKEEEKKKKEKKKKTNKVASQLNPYCSECPHRPQQSLTPKDERKYQKEKNYKKLYNLT